MRVDAKRRLVGMADEVDSKSIGGDTVRVQVPQPAVKFLRVSFETPSFLFVRKLVVDDLLIAGAPDMLLFRGSRGVLRHDTDGAHVGSASSILGGNRISYCSAAKARTASRLSFIRFFNHESCFWDNRHNLAVVSTFFHTAPSQRANSCRTGSMTVSQPRSDA